MKSPTLLAALLVILSCGRLPAAAPDAASIARRIDERLQSEWKKAGVAPHPICDDATFLRRVSLDTLGRTPTVAEVRAFAADSRSDKRQRTVARLLRSPLYAQHLARVLRRSWFPQTDVGRASFLAADTQRWIAGEIQQRTPYDEIIRDMLGVTFYRKDPSARGRVDSAAPLTFLLANEYKPDRMAANSTRAFLGVNLECAQCHDHPAARWSREQFWETAAFFVPADEDAAAQRSITIPESDVTVAARPLTAPQIAWPEKGDEATGRRLFARWLTDEQNPFFAKNAVNRLWADVFGAGLVEPLDDLSAGRKARFADLLDELAEAFVGSGYDLPLMHAAMLSTKAYQRTTAAADDNERALSLFARMRTRALTGEQLYDSLRVATGHNPFHRDAASLEELRRRRKFLELFQLKKERSTDRSVVQSLALMNGELSAALSDAERSPLIVSVAEAPFLKPGERVEAIFLATVNRPPSTAEKERVAAYLSTHGGSGGLSDVLWALLNSVEFNTNH